MKAMLTILFGILLLSPFAYATSFEPGTSEWKTFVWVCLCGAQVVLLSVLTVAPLMAWFSHEQGKTKR